MIQDSDSTFRATLTGTGMLLGTPEYMAPEMLNGEPIDHRTDIYALGIVLFQMLSGQVPFKGNTPFAVATKHLQEPPPSLRTHLHNSMSSAGKTLFPITTGSAISGFLQ